jgi:hypothetical protein
MDLGDGSRRRAQADCNHESRKLQKSERQFHDKTTPIRRNPQNTGRLAQLTIMPASAE